MTDSKTDRSGNVQTVFISYNHADLEVATRLRDRLNDAGLEVLIQNDSMRPGEPIPDFIGRAIDAADAVLSLVSRNSLLSAWVAEESMAVLNRPDDDTPFIGCCVDTAFLDPGFRVEATRKLKADIKELEELYQQHFEEGIDTKALNPQKTRLFRLRDDLGDILDALRQSHTMDLSDESFDNSVAHLINWFREHPDEPVPPKPPDPAELPDSPEQQKPPVKNKKPVPPVDVPKSWLRRNFAYVVLLAFVVVVITWSAFYKIPQLDRIENRVNTASVEFLRNLGKQDAKAIARSVTLPFFFGDYEFRDREELQAFFERLFQYASSETGRNSDSVVVRRGVAVSRYLAGEMRRDDRDVFKTVKMKVKTELDQEDEKDRGMIPLPRLPLSDGSRAAIEIQGFRQVQVIYLYFSDKHEARFRGVLLGGETAPESP
jgi:hypothetical protein